MPSCMTSIRLGFVRFGKRSSCARPPYVPRLGRYVLKAHRRDPSRRTVVIVEKPAEALPPANATTARRARLTVDECVPEALVVALAMVVRDEFGKRPSQVILAEFFFFI